ncbi:hypothetical protein DCAR_0623303 [Daucus carota subsp. sativus]|uniref:RNase H type-1 domain-containing protein n=1 Tax=Daucus carota subsp. sativus TaxID=79200 RepID=A0A164V6N6_DAUCS|nr:hypothetical protein DCAR_0623303 [Daucus carota subsp. sativus]
MLNSFLKSPWKDHELTVHSDCRELVLKVLEIGIGESKWSFLGLHRIMPVNLKIKFIPNDLNFEADCLAKKGSNSKNFNSFWVNG